MSQSSQTIQINCWNLKIISKKEHHLNYSNLYCFRFPSSAILKTKKNIPLINLYSNNHGISAIILVVFVGLFVRWRPHAPPPDPQGPPRSSGFHTGWECNNGANFESTRISVKSWIGLRARARRNAMELVNRLRWTMQHSDKQNKERLAHRGRAKKRETFLRNQSLIISLIKGNQWLISHWC